MEYGKNTVCVTYKIEGLKTYVESIKWVIQESNKRDVDNKKIDLLIDEEKDLYYINFNIMTYYDKYNQ